MGSTVPLLSSESAPADAWTTRWASMNIIRSRTCDGTLLLSGRVHSVQVDSLHGMHNQNGGHEA